jgi:hypothetical protein
MGSCEAIEQQAKNDHGEDYMETLRSNPEYMSAALSMIVSNDCEDYFDYSSIIQDFCSDHNNILAGIGPGETCKILDDNGSKMAQWCGEKEKSSDTKTRMGTQKSDCNKAGLKQSYDSAAAEYCKAHPTDFWCSCYNVLNHTTTCSNNSSAAGCTVVKNIEDNKEFFKDGYEILKNNMHCRPRVCNRPNLNYVPEGTMNTCASSYNFCGKDIDIVNESNGQIVMACNMGMSDIDEQDWWDDGGGNDSWLTTKKRRKFPFNKFPLTKLPITEFPEEFDWEEDNVRYLTYGSVGSVVSCCCCMIVIMMLMRR